MKIVILDSYTAIGRSYENINDVNSENNINPNDLSWEALEQLGDLTVYDRTKPADTVIRAKGADIVLTNKVLLRREEIERLPDLKYIGVLATGYNVVDLEAAKEHNIIVTNVPAYSTESVAQMVFSHLLTVTNHTEHYARLNREGKWISSPDFCYWDTVLTELAGKTFGIIGLGNIGQRVAAIANAFGMKVLAFTSKPENILPSYIGKRTIDELLEESDIISLHCPLTPTTKHLINRQSLQRMKQSAILINTGRGPLVCDQDVAEALNNNRLMAFCADVLTNEPPMADNPLLKCDNAYITPHIAWASCEARNRLVAVATDNVQAFINGRPKNVVSS